MPSSPGALWCRWLATGTVNEPLLADLLARAKEAKRIHDWGLALYFVDPDMTAAEEALAKRRTPKERELSEKPVKSTAKLLTQLLAYRRGTLPADVPRKSFGAVYGYCYHHESWSDLGEKIGLCCLQGQGSSPDVHSSTASPASALRQRRAARETRARADRGGRRTATGCEDLTRGGDDYHRACRDNFDLKQDERTFGRLLLADLNAARWVVVREATAGDRSTAEISQDRAPTLLRQVRVLRTNAKIP